MRMRSKLAIVAAGAAMALGMAAGPAAAATSAEASTSGTSYVHTLSGPAPYTSYPNTLAGNAACFAHAVALRASGTVRDAWCSVDEHDSSRIILWILV
jgi:hypothetical protein